MKMLEQPSLISSTTTTDQPPPPPPPPPSKQPKQECPKSSSQQSQTDHQSQTPKNPPQPTLSNPISSSAASSSSSEEDDNDDETEIETEPHFEHKPINTKQIPKTEAETQTESETDSESEPTTKTEAETDSEYEPNSKIVSSKSKPSLGTKRVAVRKTEHSKKLKPTTSVVVAVAAVDNKKTTLFQRIFTENDECVILESIINFSAETGNDPFKNYPAIYEVVKKSVHFDVTLTQLKDKIWKLRKKFLAKMEKKNAYTFSKPVERRIFELCKKIWGVELEEKGKGKSTKKESTTRKLLIEPDCDEKEDPCSTLLINEMMRFNKSVDVSGLDLDVAKRAVKLMDELKRGELHEMWKELQLEEVELVVKRAKLVEYQAILMFNALKLSSSN